MGSAIYNFVVINLCIIYSYKSCTYQIVYISIKAMKYWYMTRYFGKRAENEKNVGFPHLSVGLFKNKPLKHTSVGILFNLHKASFKDYCMNILCSLHILETRVSLAFFR